MTHFVTGTMRVMRLTPRIGRGSSLPLGIQERVCVTNQRCASKLNQAQNRKYSRSERKIMAVIDSVKQILEKNLSIDPTNVTEDSTLESLDIDSLDLVELICDLEDVEDIDFGEPEGLTTVGDIVKHVESLK